MLESGGEQIILVAEDKGELLGFACAYINEDTNWGSFLNNIHVKQAMHRRGVGTALLNAVAKRCTTPVSGLNAATDTSQRLYLFVIQANIAAQRFYTHHGAQNVGVDVWDAPDGGRVPLYRFAWEDVGRLDGV